MKDDEILRQYLLGRLSEEQADVIEGRLLRDGDLFELAEAVEGDLFAAAARGELSPADRGYVRWWLARSPEGRARYTLASGLVAISHEPVPAEDRFIQLATRSWVRAVTAAASVAFVVGGLWLGTHPDDHFKRLANRMPSTAPSQPSPSPDSPVVIAEQDPAPVTPAAEEEHVAEQEPAAPPEPAAWIYQLALSQLRGPDEGIPVMKVPPGTRQIEIQLPLNPDEPTTLVTATLRNASTEKVIRRARRIAPRDVNGRRMVVLTVPATQLDPGTYDIEVLGIAPEEDLLGQPTFEVAPN